jgi:cytochrome c biogenesis factor
VLVEIGHFALVLALLVALVQGTLPLVGATVRSRPLMDLGRTAALLQFGLVALAFAVFMHAHIVSDFSVRNVFENSNTAKPMLYKVSGVWGSHEGSMMLWVLMLTLFGALVAALGRALPATLRSRTLAIQGLLGFGTLAFIIGTSNPFDRLFPVPADGRDLNPLLQDPGLAFHPPFLYFGYVDHLLLCDCRAARRTDRRRVGPMDAALGLDRLVRADRRHRYGQLVGLLCARLGRLVVLGPGRECVLYAMAARNRAAALGISLREA